MERCLSVCLFTKKLDSNNCLLALSVSLHLTLSLALASQLLQSLNLFNKVTLLISTIKYMLRPKIKRTER